MERILARHKNESIVVISHGAVICSYLTWVLGMDIDDLWSFSLPNASVTTLLVDFKLRLRCFGDISHLESAPCEFDGIPAP